MRTVPSLIIRWIRVFFTASNLKKKTRKGNLSKYTWLQEKKRKLIFLWLSFTASFPGTSQRLSSLYTWFGHLCLTRSLMSMEFTTFQINIMRLRFLFGLLWPYSQFSSSMLLSVCFIPLTSRAMILCKTSFQSLKTQTLRNWIT